MRFREIIAEKRRNASVNKKASGLSQLLKYEGQDDVFVTFTTDVGVDSNPTEITPTDRETGVRAKGPHHNVSGSKVGINPQSKYDTPLGIYAYPVDYVIQKETRMEFAASKPYMYVFRSQGNVLDLRSYTEADMNNDIEKLMKLYDPLSMSEVRQWAKDATTKTPGGTIWNITRNIAIKQKEYDAEPDYEEDEPDIDDFDDYDDYELAHEEWLESTKKKEITAAPTKWNTIFRALGYSGVVDMDGLGIIHENEATQGVFFSIKSIKALERIANIDPDAAWGNDRIWIENPTLFINQMKKGKVPTDEIIHFMAGHEFMFQQVDFKYFPEDVQKYIFNHPDEFMKKSAYAMRYVPFPPASQVKIIAHNPEMVRALDYPLPAAVRNYVVKNFDSFSKLVPDVVSQLPPAAQIGFITKEPVLITHLPGSPTLVATPVLMAIIDIDPSLFIKYFQSYDAGKMHPTVVAKFFKQYIRPKYKDLVGMLTHIATKFPPATLAACLQVTDKRNARAFYKLASGPLDGNVVQKDWTRATDKPPSMLAAIIRKARPDIAV